MTSDNIDGLDISEYLTRKELIDKDLLRAGWIKGKNWTEEYELQGMPNVSNVGYADYVLFGDDGYPLAVVEAKRTSKDPSVGRQQAILYANLLEEKFKRRPIIFTTNGYETFIHDDRNYPERRVSGVYSKRDLEKLITLTKNRSKILHDASINDEISNRYYQKNAIKAVCSTFENKGRKALLVMATGSGKTRTVISLVDVLMRKGWVRNILFLADRTALVSQAYDAFVNLLPSLSVTNMCSGDRDPLARGVFSTYQTMINCIDTTKTKDGELIFTSGHFDLIVVDEAHRSIYNKYRSIFEYFDSLLVGLTATPKDEIDKNTYDIFNLKKGEPTYGYELNQAVLDGYLVDYKTIETKLKFLEEGISYIDLTEEEKEEYEELFLDPETGEIPEHIDSSEMNKWIFNKNTVIQVLDQVMRLGIKIDSGSKIGKTIIFAKNHKHAEFIYEVFGEQYPSYTEYCKVIDYATNYSDSAIREFKKPNDLPQIAISVDMLDTGIDVPEVVNLVFFKKVFSKSKFWQMIGRGTRLCPGLLDGKDKEFFYIFDYCGNFEFFRLNDKGIEGNQVATVQGVIFQIKAELIYILQDIKYQTPEFIDFRKELIADVLAKIRELNRENFAVKQHLRFVDLYSQENTFEALTKNDVIHIENELAQLILPYNDDVQAVRFDALLSRVELGHLVNPSYNARFFREIRNKVSRLKKQTTIPDVYAKMDVIKTVLTEGYLEKCEFDDFEHIRKELRDIMKYMEKDIKLPVDSNLTDLIMDIKINDSELSDEGFTNYREKAEHYIQKHQDEGVIRKLKTNIPLNDSDIAELEEILWSELGTRDDYEAAFGSKSLGILVREINGMDMNAAKEAFSSYLNDANLKDEQIYFVNQIIEYIVQNGVILNMGIFTESPFNDKGSVAELFDMSEWSGIKKIIKSINENAESH